MNYEILARPSYSLIEVELGADETIVADSGAMAWMSPNIVTKTSTRGGLFAGLKRKLLSGESFFQNTFAAEGGTGSVALAPGSAGDVVAIELNDEELLLEKGAYVASSEGVVCDAQYGGILRGFFNEGIFVLRCHGTGTLFFSAYGEIQEVEVRGQYVVDNGYAVAWDPQLDYRITTGPRIRSFLFGDQLRLNFEGHGRVWVQTRSPRALADWVHPFRPVKSNNSDGGGGGD